MLLRMGKKMLLQILLQGAAFSVFQVIPCQLEPGFETAQGTMCEARK